MKNNYLDSNIIFENKFSQEILILAQNIVIKDKLDWKDNFIMEVFKYFCEISEKFDDINYSYLHILNYPNNKTYRKIFPIKKYNSYHTEIYLIKIIALFDRFLHLINLLYDLKLNWLNLKIDNIKKSNKIGENILLTLENFNNKITELRKSQNYIKHEWTLDIEELQKISTYEFLLNHSNNLDEEIKKTMNLFIKLEFKKYKKNHRDKLLANTKWIADFINNILWELYSIFINKINEFK